EDHDLALLIIKKGNQPKLNWVSGKPAVKLGERVFAVSGRGGAGASITQGNVADVFARGIQHTAPVGAAYRGSPLVNSDGEVVVGKGDGATARGAAGPVSQGPSQSAGVPDGVRRGPGSMPARALRWMSAAAGLMGGGWSKSVMGTSARAWTMKSCHVLAGMVP